MSLRTSTLTTACGVAVVGLGLLWLAEPAGPPTPSAPPDVAAAPTSLPQVQRTATVEPPASAPGRAELASDGRAALRVIANVEAPEPVGARRQALAAVHTPEPAPTTALTAMPPVPPQPAEAAQAQPRVALQEIPAQPMPPVSRVPYVPQEAAPASAAQR